MFEHFKNNKNPKFLKAVLYRLREGTEIEKKRVFKQFESFDLLKFVLEAFEAGIES